jgi:hypothetical protein
MTPSLTRGNAAFVDIIALPHGFCPVSQSSLFKRP